MGSERIQSLLEAMLWPGATFRRGQREAIEAVLKPSARVLVVQRTGWGKSLVYWIATRLRRDAGAGPTIIISPLLSLMRNQIAMAEAIGIRAMTINSANADEWDAVQAALEAGNVDVLLISPERLANAAFLDRVLPALGAIGMVVVDEAHCISDWGHDFRPDYRRIKRILDALPPTIPVLATTATANDRVIADVAEQLGERVEVLRGPLARKSLSLYAIPLADQAERLAWLAENLESLPGTGIIYCLTVADTFRVAEWLRSRGLEVAAYNSVVEPAAREAIERALLGNTLKAVVATTALGMGFDKPDLGFVIHYQRPGSVIAYYQQIGRAGRAVDHADVVLLTGREDDDIVGHFIETAFPPVAVMEAVLEALDRHREASIYDLEGELNQRRAQIERALKLLEIDGAVAREGGRYFRTLNPWHADAERIDRVTATRRLELEEMRTYTAIETCRMEFLGQALDDPAAVVCGRCDNDGGPPLPLEPDSDLVAAATTYLRRDARAVEPRRQWAPGAVSGLRGRIRHLNMPGMALSIYGDAGWGRLVREGKYVHGTFDPALVEATYELISERWRPEPAPIWVTAVPSARRPNLVPDFAAALANRLGLPFYHVLGSRAGAEQKGMENMAQRLRNVEAKLVLTNEPPPGPVLLVDDIKDSGWTLTYAGWLLAEAGVEVVWPFALAEASNRGDT